MKKLTLSLVALTVLSLLVSQSRAKDDNKKAAVGQPVPSFTLQDTNGKTVSLADYSGKIVVLEWINPGCPFVVRHHGLNTMTTLANKYKGKDVAWLAINTPKDNNADAMKQFAQKHNIDYPVLTDTDTSVAKMYGAKTTPHMFIIDKAGNLAYSGGIDNQESDSGPVNSDTINYVDKALAELTSGQSVSTPESKPYGCGVKVKD
jgi:peroxiredoxin